MFNTGMKNENEQLSTTNIGIETAELTQKALVWKKIIGFKFWTPTIGTFFNEGTLKSLLHKGFSNHSQPSAAQQQMDGNSRLWALLILLTNILIVYTNPVYTVPSNNEKKSSRTCLKNRLLVVSGFVCPSVNDDRRKELASCSVG